VARAGDVGPQTGSTGVKPEVPGRKNLGNMLEKELKTPEIHVEQKPFVRGPGSQLLISNLVVIEYRCHVPS